MIRLILLLDKFEDKLPDLKLYLLFRYERDTSFIDDKLLSLFNINIHAIIHLSIRLFKIYSTFALFIKAFYNYNHHFYTLYFYTINIFLNYILPMIRYPLYSWNIHLIMSLIQLIYSKHTLYYLIITAVLI